MGERFTVRVTGNAVFLALTPFFLASLVAAAVAHAAPSAQDAGQGKSIFEQKCASCHSIGGGKLVGPDLKGVTATRAPDWLVEFITAPDQAIASGDPAAKQLVQEFNGIQMPNLGLTSAQADDVLAYIQQQSGTATPATAPAAAPAPAGNAANGHDLFIGSRTLANREVPCIGCHNVANVGALGGGTWGLDLTHAYSKWGEMGLVSIMQAPPFPGMQQDFLDHALTAQEVADLTAYLAETDKQPATPTSAWAFPVIGFISFGMLAGLAQLVWRRRLSGVRKPFLRGHSSSGSRGEPVGRLGSGGALGGSGFLGGQK